MTIKISEAELLDALADATKSNAPEDARTVNELMAETGIPRGRMLIGLRLLQAQRRLTVHRVARRTIDGRFAPVQAYTVSPAPKATRKRGR